MATTRIPPATLLCLGLVMSGGSGAAQMPPAAAPKPAAGPAAAQTCPAPQEVFDGIGRHGDFIPPRPEVWPMVPPYPKTLRDRDQHGVVLADYVVGRDGSVCNIHVSSVQGPRDFADATAAWLAVTPFAAATKAGQPIVAEVKRVMTLGRRPRPTGGLRPDAGIPPSANQNAPDNDPD
jgi:outer membrane biosynthesis protein TonB